MTWPEPCDWWKCSELSTSNAEVDKLTAESSRQRHNKVTLGWNQCGNINMQFIFQGKVRSDNDVIIELEYGVWCGKL